MNLNEKPVGECYAFELALVIRNLPQDGMRGSAHRRAVAQAELDRRAQSGDEEAVRVKQVLAAVQPHEGRKLGIIGRDRMLINKLAKRLLESVTTKTGWTTPLRELDRGFYFEVLICDPDGPTSHVARVTVELDRLDPDAKAEAEAHLARKRT